MRGMVRGKRKLTVKTEKFLNLGLNGHPRREKPLRGRTSERLSVNLASPQCQEGKKKGQSDKRSGDSKKLKTAFEGKAVLELEEEDQGNLLTAKKKKAWRVEKRKHTFSSEPSRQRRE